MKRREVLGMGVFGLMTAVFGGTSNVLADESHGMEGMDMSASESDQQFAILRITDVGGLEFHVDVISGSKLPLKPDLPILVAVDNLGLFDHDLMLHQYMGDMEMGDVAMTSVIANGGAAFGVFHVDDSIDSVRLMCHTNGHKMAAKIPVAK